MKNYECYFDGCCEPCNPDGTMGMGIYIIDDCGNEYRKHECIEAKTGNTNNIAEYLALTMVLKVMRNKVGDCIKIYGDSKLVVEQTNGKWKLKKGLYLPYASICIPMFNELQTRNYVTLEWIPREMNEEADVQSKMHLQL